MRLKPTVPNLKELMRREQADKNQQKSNFDVNHKVRYCKPLNSDLKTNS